MKSPKLTKSLGYVLRSAVCHPPPAIVLNKNIRGSCTYILVLLLAWSANTTFSCLVWDRKSVATRGHRATISPGYCTSPVQRDWSRGGFISQSTWHLIYHFPTIPSRLPTGIRCTHRLARSEPLNRLRYRGLTRTGKKGDADGSIINELKFFAEYAVLRTLLLKEMISPNSL
jgi:hypothetical protein